MSGNLKKLHSINKDRSSGKSSAYRRDLRCCGRVYGLFPFFPHFSKLSFRLVCFESQWGIAKWTSPARWETGLWKSLEPFSKWLNRCFSRGDGKSNLLKLAQWGSVASVLKSLCPPCLDSDPEVKMIRVAVSERMSKCVMSRYLQSSGSSNGSSRDVQSFFPDLRKKSATFRSYAIRAWYLSSALLVMLDRSGRRWVWAVHEVPWTSTFLDLHPDGTPPCDTDLIMICRYWISTRTAVASLTGAHCHGVYVWRILVADSLHQEDVSFAPRLKNKDSISPSWSFLKSLAQKCLRSSEVRQKISDG